MNERPESRITGSFTDHFKCTFLQNGLYDFDQNRSPVALVDEASFPFGFRQNDSSSHFLERFSCHKQVNKATFELDQLLKQLL